MADPRPLVDRIAALSVEPVPGGAVIRVVGLPPRQGWYGAELVPVPRGDDDVLAFQLRALPPDEPTRVSTPRSRQLVVARNVTDQELQGVRRIRVDGLENALVARR